MTTQAQLYGLVHAHFHNDRDHFRIITKQIIAAHEAKGNVNVARRLRSLVHEVPGKLVELSHDQSKVMKPGTAKHSFNELFLSSTNHEEIEEFIAEWKAGPKLKEKDLPPRRRILLLGPPGTGKTATAGALARALNIPFFVIRLEGVIDSYLGATGKKLDDVFSAVRSIEGVYLIDEFDALGAAREGTGHRDHAEMRRALNTLLLFLEEEAAGIVVAATNLTRLLDHAVFRRFDLILTFTLPTSGEAKSLIERVFSRAQLTPRLEWKRVLEECKGLSYAEIEKAAMGAARKRILHDQDWVDHESLITKLQMMKR